MSDVLSLSEASRTTAAVLILSIVVIETGGLYLLAIHRGQVQRTPFQIAFARAGHAHAGVLVTLSLVIQLFADATTLSDPWSWLARSGIPAAAILMPIGFFASSSGAGRTSPSRLVGIVYLGAVFLALGALTLGIGLLVAPTR
jgi:hypothetical protein